MNITLKYSLPVKAIRAQFCDGLDNDAISTLRTLMLKKQYAAVSLGLCDCSLAYSVIGYLIGMYDVGFHFDLTGKYVINAGGGSCFWDSAPKLKKWRVEVQENNESMLFFKAGYLSIYTIIP